MSDSTQEEHKEAKSETDEVIEKETQDFLATESKEEQINALEGQVEKFRKEAEELKDSWTRERAEFQNYKKRTIHEFAHIKRDAVKNFVAGLLNPIDNLERVAATSSVTDEMKSFVDGVEMIRKEIISVLEKESIIKLIPMGDEFDPTCMEAISSEEGDSYTVETVVEVYQPGYVFKTETEQFVLRPARVKVGKPL